MKRREKDIIAFHLWICVLILIAYTVIIVSFCFSKNIKNKQIIELQNQNEQLKEVNKELESHECRVEETKIIIEHTEDLETKLNFLEKSMNYIEPLMKYDKLEYFNQYKQIISDYENVIDSPETIYDYFTEEQIRMMWKCIETETYDCPFDAKVGVACVILNRVEHDMFPTDPIEVIKSPNQFAYGRNNITDTTKLALEYAFEIEDVTNGCVGFRSDVNPQKWNGWTYKYTDGYHYFYSMEGDD